MVVSSLVKKDIRTEILLNDMDISRIMFYAQQIEESKIKEIRKEGKRPRSDDSRNPKTKRRFYHKDSSMVILLRGIGALLVEINIWVGV